MGYFKNLDIERMNLEKDKEGLENELEKVNKRLKEIYDMPIKQDVEKYYNVTSTCKEDIISAFEGRDDLKQVRKRVKKLTEKEMIFLAKKLSEDYCNQLYWDSLRIIFLEKFL